MMEIHCPECGSEDIEYERRGEYTGGGFSDYWDEYFCVSCDYEWSENKKHDRA